MVNPLDLRGPQFLLFYLCLGIAVTIVAVWVRRSREHPADPPRPLADYLEIAFLRGGAAETVRVAILNLVDRGVLALSGETVQIAAGEQTAHLFRPTERAIATRARQVSKAAELLADRDVTRAATAECEPELVRRGLLPSPSQQASRHGLWVLTGGTLAFVAGLKIAVAVARGRSNVGFLVILGFAFVVVTFIITHPRRTAAGSALLADMTTLFKGLKDRASSLRPRENGNDVALLAAIYGVSAAFPVHPDMERLFPRPSTGGDSSSGSSGSSCGSSSSSCGSSCGGGGGGCGGCGS